MTTLPDTNVRLARRATAGSARIARSSGLARLLLCLLQHVSKLDRKLLLLFVASPLSACVIPAGPEFQDPPGVPNAPPYVVALSPAEGVTLTGDDAEFSVTVGDVNLDDTIYYKWITEYPPNITNITNDQGTRDIKPTANSNPTRPAFSFTPTCTQVNPLVTTHQIMVAISDRKFTGLLTTESPIPPTTRLWFWQQACSMGSP